MKQKGILITILIILLFIGVGAYLFLSQNNNNDSNSQKITLDDQDSFYQSQSKEEWGCTNVPSGGFAPDADLTNDECYWKIARDTGFIPYSICFFIDDLSLKSTCIAGAWSTLNDLSVCVSIDFGSISSANSMGLKDHCYYDLAKSLKNPNLCEEISFDINKDGCYTNYALFNKDQGVCSEISGNTQLTRDNCILLATI